MGSAIVRLSAERSRLLRHHARLTSPAAMAARHDAWGVCDCDTAKRLRAIAVALAKHYTSRAATGDHPSEARRGHASEGRGGPDAR